MIVVSDTGPLNYLALIGHVEALPKLYEVVVIPKAVASELSRPSCPEMVRALIESPPVWLKIDQAPEPDPDLGALGDGEQQALLWHNRCTPTCCFATTEMRATRPCARIFVSSAHSACFRRHRKTACSTSPML